MTATAFNPSAPLRACTRCPPSRVTGDQVMYLDDPPGRKAHAAALGHYPATTEPPAAPNTEEA